MARNFGHFKDIGIPPESTGPRIHNVVFQSLNLTSIAGGTIVPEMNIVGLTSGATGVIRKIVGQSITVVVDNNSPVRSFQSESVEIADATITATVTAVTDVAVNATTNVSGNNPYHVQEIDVLGAANVRFAEGGQQMDSFGVTKTAQSTTLDTFLFQYAATASNIQDEIVGGATLTHLPDESTALLTAPTGATDSITRTSNRYYVYRPGVGRAAMFTVAMGDMGKVGNFRNFGLFDEGDGVFFGLQETNFVVGFRSSVTGSSVDTTVSQANWNGDVMDGTGSVDNPSGENLDVTKLNIYWVDYGWLGAGRIRFGLYTPNGERVVLHTFFNVNQHPGAYMKTGSLPIRWENFNDQITAGSSSMKTACGVIMNDTQQVDDVFPTVFSHEATLVSAPTGSEAIIFSLRSGPTFNGITNRKISIGQGATVYTATDAVIIRVYANATLNSPTWAAINALSPLEVDTAATLTTPGLLVASTIVGLNQSMAVPLDNLSLHLNADGTTGTIFTVTAQSLGAGASNTSMTFNWIDRGA